MRFAYADPPYPGQSKRLYGKHPDYAGEVDHAEMIARLVRDYPDGWALSTSVEALQQVLAMCPRGVRVAVWYVTNRRPTTGVGRWHFSWEPVIMRGGRPGWGEGLCVRDVLSFPAPQASGDITGQKPPAFCRWIFDLLGAREGDELDDIFPGNGIVGREWLAYLAQPPILPLALRDQGTKTVVYGDHPTGGKTGKWRLVPRGQGELL